MRVCESYSDLCLGDNLESLMSCVASICIVFFQKTFALLYHISNEISIGLCILM